MSCPWLAECRQSYEETHAHVDRLYAELSAEELAWKPADDRWSVLQCIDHLGLVRDRHLQMLRKAVQGGREKRMTGGEAPYGRGTVIGRLVLGAFQKPRKLNTAKRFHPGDRPNPVEVVQTFREHNAALIALTKEADGLSLGRIKVGAPASALVRLSLAQGFHLHVLHDARHLVQAEAVQEEPGFPVT